LVAGQDSAIPKEYLPFVLLSGCVSLLESSKEIPVSILRDIGVAQSLTLEDILPFSSQSATGNHKVWSWKV